MRIAIYPGSFDPITYGHLDVIDRALNIFDKVIVSIVSNISKKPLFSVQERIEQIKDALKDKADTEVDSFEGLVVDYANSKNAHSLIRGLRAVTDFEYEMQMALMNRKLSKELVTVFLMPNEKYTYLNSTIVREIAEYNGDVSRFVTPYVADKLKEKFK